MVLKWVITKGQNPTQQDTHSSIRTTAAYSTHLFLTIKYGALSNQTKLVIFFEVLMVMTFKITVIRDVMPRYFTQIYQHFGQTCPMNILPQRLRE